MNKNLNNIPLNLDDPAVLDALKAVDVDKTPVKAEANYDEKIAKTIKERQKAASFSLKLTLQQVEKLTRDGASIGLSWRQYLEQQVNELIFSKNIGSATISSPTFGRKKVVGPSSWLKDNE
tara:strand:+ start:88 stop:450 length:363 start_codon:yes stop_codon:yes gene_type:complete